MSLIFCFRLVLTVALMILDDIELLIYPILYLVFFGDKFTAKTISIFSGINSKNIVESQPISIGENQVDTFNKKSCHERLVPSGSCSSLVRLA